MEKNAVASQILIVQQNPKGELIGPDGKILIVPSGWSFLAAGDAGVTRKVTAKGEYWRVEYPKGRRTFSSGIWAPTNTIIQAKQDVQQVRATDQYRKKQMYAADRREKQQADYETEFCRTVEDFLCFHPAHKELEKKLAMAVTAHAIPVGSGTVARTQMIPVEERAARAVIAWMRHQTTAYDNLKIARIKGERHAVRRMLAQQSVDLLANYREGNLIPLDCPLKKALSKFKANYVKFMLMWQWPAFRQLLRTHHNRKERCNYGT